MLLEVAEKEVSSDELVKIIRFIKSKQSINIDLNKSIDICGT
jgi:hypothetical protein